LFYFSSFSHPRDLHSFPTRRSSDLDRTIKNAANKSSDDLIIALIYWFSIKDNKFLNFSASYFKNTSKANLFSFLNFKTNISVFEDRKSTRLNSSHVKISYAVFCLKK